MIIFTPTATPMDHPRSTIAQHIPVIQLGSTCEAEASGWRMARKYSRKNQILIRQA